MKKTIDLDIELIKGNIDYNPETGLLTWIDNYFKNRIGKEIGSVSMHGYRKVTFGGVTYLCHRLAWAIHYGEQPPEIIDHIDGNRLNNKIENLRKSDSFHNLQNQRKPMKSNKTSNYLGVSRFKGRWRAKIKANGKYVFLGYHETEEQARDAYIEAKRKIHQGCTI